MTENNPHLLELFWEVRQAGLPLSTEDYGLLLRAMESGFTPQNLQEFQQLCRRLWVKSIAEKDYFTEGFARYQAKWLVKPTIGKAEDRENNPPDLSPIEKPQPESVENDSNNLLIEEETEGEEIAAAIETSDTPARKDAIGEFSLKDEYFPVTRKSLKQGIKSLRDFSPVRNLTELDIPATVKQISQDGFFLAPVYRSCRAKKTEVVLLIDQSNSMLPFADICDRLVESLSQLTSCSNFNKSKNLTPQPPSLRGKGGKEKGEKEKEILPPSPLRRGAGGEVKSEILPPSPLRGEVKSEILPPSPLRGGAGGEVKNKPNLPLFPKIPVYYFRNSPQPSLYTEAKLIPTHKQKLAQLLPKFNPNYTSILIFSDGGAARGGLNPHRIELTADFLAQVKPFVRQIVWLNPVPKSRWESTTASYIADDVPMFDFTPSGWRNLLRCLRGFRETKPLNLDNLFVVGTSVPKNNLFPSTEVLTTNFQSGNDNQLKYQIAARKINSFAARGEGYLEFAYHAAFPLALTTDLLHYLRQNFQPNIPWYVVPDLLLSNLCHSVGYNLYEMDSAIRHYLLKCLTADKRFGATRLHRLSDALLFYIEAGIGDRTPEELGEKPEWIALGYTAPTALAKQLALRLKQVYGGDAQKQIYTASLVGAFAQPLAENNFQPLLILAQGLGRRARGNQAGGEELFAQLDSELNSEGKLNIAGVSLPIPGRSRWRVFVFETPTVNRRGEIIKQETKKVRYYIDILPGNILLEMMDIPGGTFLMGSPSGEGYDNERPQHEVTISPFYMAKYPITQAQWRGVAEGLPKVERDLDPNPAYFKNDDKVVADTLPVEQVSWYDCVEFCARLSRHTGKTYRLPSEAEWEYACRAGTTTPFAFGETLTSELANYNANYTFAEESKGVYREKTTPVGSFPPNAFGLFSMHGNVWEWCADDWHDSYDHANSAGTIWLSSDELINKIKLLRGGVWIYNPGNCRSAFRVRNVGVNRYNHFGFRVVSFPPRIP